MTHISRITAPASRINGPQQQISLLCRIVMPQTPRFARSLEQLDYRLGQVFAYLESNHGSPIAYGKHYRAHKPISPAMAESPVHNRGNHTRANLSHYSRRDTAHHPL